MAGEAGRLVRLPEKRVRQSVRHATATWRQGEKHRPETFGNGRPSVANEAELHQTGSRRDEKKVVKPAAICRSR